MVGKNKLLSLGEETYNKFFLHDKKNARNVLLMKFRNMEKETEDKDTNAEAVEMFGEGESKLQIGFPKRIVNTLRGSKHFKSSQKFMVEAGRPSGNTLIPIFPAPESLLLHPVPCALFLTLPSSEEAPEYWS